MRELSLLEMLQKGVHFGHQESRRHPKMRPFIFTSRNGIHIIDLAKTHEKLREAVSFLEGISAKGGVILFVGTKRQAKQLVKSCAQLVGMPSVTERWIGGLLTNFETILKLIISYKTLQRQVASGELEKYTKKERLTKQRELERLEKLVGGIASLEKLPDAIVLVDVRKEKTALAEALKMRVPTVAIVDTNVNPDTVTYPIPGNDDATKSIDLLLNILADAIKDGASRRAADALAREKAEAEAANRPPAVPTGKPAPVAQPSS